MLAQRTIKALAHAVGVGLHGGERVELLLRPAPPVAVDAQLEALDAGAVIELDSASDPDVVIQAIQRCLQLGGPQLRERTQDQLDLDQAVVAYRDVYARLEAA